MIQGFRKDWRRYVFQILTGLVLLATWSWVYAPSASAIATTRARTDAHVAATRQYDAAIANRSYYDSLKAQTLRELNSINVEPTMAQTEAAFLREVGVIARENDVSWRAIKPNLTASTSTPAPAAAPTASPAPALIALPGPSASPAFTGIRQGIVEQRAYIVAFRGRNDGVFKAIRALGTGRVLVHATAAGFAVENTPNGPQISAQVGVVIERVNVDENTLFPASPTFTASTAPGSSPAPGVSPTPFVPPTTQAGGANVRT